MGGQQGMQSRSLVVVWAIASLALSVTVETQGAAAHQLSATSVQRLAAAVDTAASMASSSEQLVATSRSLEESGKGSGSAGSPVVEEDAFLVESLRTLGEVNLALRTSLQRLRDELELLFTTGKSSRLGSVLRELTDSPAMHGSALRAAATVTATWVHHCQMPDAKVLYTSFETMRAEHSALEVKLHSIDDKVHALRHEHATADGRLAGLEDLLGLRRNLRRGEEYEVARYLGSSLFRWELLRVKVAHHLAYAFTEAHEEALRGAGDRDIKGAEKHLGLLEEQLGHFAETHKNLAERRATLGNQLRSFLKSLLLGCLAASGEVTPDATVSKRFGILRNKRLGVNVQAAEEFARFLNNTFTYSLPQTVALIQEVLGPHLVTADEYRLPMTWKSRPKIGRWWEWLEEEGGGDRPLAHDEFERRFAAAKRRFSVRASAQEPMVMAYLFWLLLEEIMGSKAHGGHTEVLALPSPPELAKVRSEIADGGTADSGLDLSV